MRGTIVIDAARCKGCELCLAVCPKALIRLGDHFTPHEYHPAVLIDPTPDRRQRPGAAMTASPRGVHCADGD